VDIHNATPNAAGLTPEAIFSNSKNTPRLHTFHPFGCPIFVFEPSLRQGHKIPKWKPRSRVGIYLGMSPEHASTVPLVLSTTTGLISPQFHVIFDNQFTTTESLHTNKIPTNWPSLLSTSSISYVDEDFTKTNFYSSQWQPSNITQTHPSSSHQREPSTSLQLNLPSSSVHSSSFQREPSHESPDISSNMQAPASQSTSQSSSGWNPNHCHDTRFKRRHVANIEASNQPPNILADSSLSALLATQDLFPSSNSIAYHALQTMVTDNSPLPKDTLHFEEMQRDPDHELFEQDMRREISDLFTSDTVQIVSRSTIPPDNKPLYCQIQSQIMSSWRPTD
jgi:hypothetical protein